MTQQRSPNQQTLWREIRKLRDGQRTVVMATASADGEPEASATPYVTDNTGDYYILISGLAEHTRNLRQNNRVSLLFLEPEEQTGQIYARPRLTLRCRAESIARDSELWDKMLGRLLDRFGPVVKQLRSLPDFQLLRICPLGGRYVRGFGESYELRGQELEPIKP